jgi:hypothetical protein
VNAASRDAVPLDEASRLLLDSLAEAAPAVAAASRAQALRERLMGRVAHSVRAASAFHTVRGELQWLVGAAGLRAAWLYGAQPGRALRAGEPRRVRQIELAPGARCELAIGPAVARCEWLVMRGDACIDDAALEVRDYHVAAAGGAVALSSEGGALLYLRETDAAGDDHTPHTLRDREVPWLPHAPGIERRVLWQRGREAALLYRVQPGAAVPHHGHGHDEECLMLEGEVFVDDILLRDSDYQLAPAGTFHEGVCSDTGGILYAHGDIELAVTSR